jgi:hypothetical protein
MRMLITALLIALASSAPAQLLTTEYGSGGFSTVVVAPCGTGTIDVSGTNLCILPLMLGLAR